MLFSIDRDKWSSLRLLHNAESEKCLSEGVDVVMHFGPLAGKFFSLTLVLADKEGGFFIVLDKARYNSKAHEAISSIFQVHKDLALKKVQNDPKKLCRSFKLDHLSR